MKLRFEDFAPSEWSMISLEQIAGIGYFEKFQKSESLDTDAVAISDWEFCGNEGFCFWSEGLFFERKWSQVAELYPKNWIRLYFVVTFSEIPYSEAYAQGSFRT